MSRANAGEGLILSKLYINQIHKSITQQDNVQAKKIFSRLNTNMEIQTSYTPSFTGYKSVFSKKLEKALKTQRMSRQQAGRLLHDFADMYDKRVRMDKKIGSGFYGTVYKIDDNYVLKRGNENLTPEFIGFGLVRKPKFGHLKHYFGEAVAKIRNKIGEDMLILKNVYSKGKSIPVGVPVEFAQNHTKEECLKYYAENYLPKFAKLPQRSFDGIAKDFSQLNKMSTKRKFYTFDYVNPNNFVLSGKTLRILDDVNEMDTPATNCVTDMLEVFINKLDMDKETVFDEKLIPLRKELAKKLILAGARHEVPMCQSSIDLNSWAKTFNDLLGMEDLDVGVMVSDINSIVHVYDKPKIRVDVVKQYLEEFIGL